jgi:hypothetical protein
MAQHKLSLEALDVMNDCVLRIVDTSVYSTSVPVECPILEITLPGFKYSIQFGEATTPAIAPGFMLNLTACDLELQFDNCGSKFTAFPDGIYTIKYSIAPNDEVYVEYNHLRITQALNCYQKIMCDIDVADCEPTKEIAKQLEQLRMIKMYLEAAKAKVETCHEPKKGMQLYSYAMKLLSKFECKSCH